LPSGLGKKHKIIWLTNCNQMHDKNMGFLPYLSAQAEKNIDVKAYPVKKAIPNDEINHSDLQYRLYFDIQLYKDVGS
jgi:hypothetical protein